MYDIPFDRWFLQLSNGIKHVMPSTDRKLELKAKASMAQPALSCSGLITQYLVGGCVYQILHSGKLYIFHRIRLWISVAIKL